MIRDIELPNVRVHELSRDAEFLSAMRAFYERLEKNIAARRPVCRNRGDCCRFDDFGHNLYVTPAELACFLGTVEENRVVSGAATTCPCRSGGLCRARSFRPMGCRVFFCESAGLGWQESLTESALAELRNLHERFDLPYAYVEWRHGLRQVSRGAQTPPHRGA